jgi:hypothetical protein
MTKYFLVNNQFGLISGCDYGSAEAAKAAIKTSNIPEQYAEIVTFDFNFLDKRDTHPQNYINNPNSKIRPGVVI